MTGRTESSFKKTWNILVPFLLYFVVHDLAQVLLAFLMDLSLGFFGGGYRELMINNAATVNGILNALSLVIGMAAVWPMAAKEFCWAAARREEQEKNSAAMGRPEMPGIQTQVRREQAAGWLLLAVFSVSLALGLNILLTLLGLTQISPAYTQVAVKQYGVAFGAGILVYGILSPLAEEIVFRGLIYNRMKRYFNTVLSVIVCGILFGIYHGNLVQGIYGCVLGIAITFSYELFGSFLAPVLFHSLANASVFVVGYNQQLLGSMTTLSNCVIFMTISLLSLFFLLKLKLNLKPKKKQP